MTITAILLFVGWTAHSIGVNSEQAIQKRTKARDKREYLANNKQRERYQWIFLLNV